MNHFSSRLGKLSGVCAAAYLALIAAPPVSALGSPGGPVAASSNGVVGSFASAGNARATGGGSRVVSPSSGNKASATMSSGGLGSVGVGTRSVGTFHPTTPVAGALGSTGGGFNVGTATSPRPSALAGRTAALPDGFRPATIPRHNNPWTDPASTANTASSTHFLQPSSSGRTYRQGSNIYNRNFIGTTLYPGAYGYRQNSPTGTADIDDQRRRQNNSRQQGYNYPHNGFYRHLHRGSYYPYFAGYGYGGYFPYGSFFDGAAGFNDSLLFDGGATSPSYAPAGIDASVNTDQSAAEPTLPVPPPVGPQMSSAQPTTALGPDSLVEAVQTELTRLGYFAGKADAIYGQDTRLALQRFQTDQALPATGRINAATLHALQLD